jgi:hypothetical protein
MWGKLWRGKKKGLKSPFPYWLLGGDEN